FTGTMVAGWGTGQSLLALFGPSLAREPRAKQIAARCERLTATPSALRGLWRMNASIDVRHVLPRIAVPAPVMPPPCDRVVPVAAGRWLADHLLDARFVELPGDDHFPFAGDIEPVVCAIAQLLEVTAPAVVQATARTDAVPMANPPL